MISGQMYNAGDEELGKDRDRCGDLCHDYNQLKTSQTEQCTAVMRQLLGGCGNKFILRPNVWFDYGYNITIGENFFSNYNLVILDCAKVTFGDNVFIAPNCGFYTATHPTDAEQRNADLEYALPITVGNNVWIGGGVTVLPGVEIGDNCVIGAGSVVVKSIPANSVAVGNPCKVIRKV